MLRPLALVLFAFVFGAGGMWFMLTDQFDLGGPPLWIATVATGGACALTAALALRPSRPRP